MTWKKKKMMEPDTDISPEDSDIADDKTFIDYRINFIKKRNISL
jgi:hypothetical protein